MLPNANTRQMAHALWNIGFVYKQIWRTRDIDQI